jgi:hypothetical protein
MSATDALHRSEDGRGHARSYWGGIGRGHARSCEGGH